MVDPFTAFAAAGNVAQFLVYGAQIVCKSNELRKSQSGALLEHEQISLITGDLSKVAAGLQSFLAAAKSSGPLDEDDEALLEICSGCEQLAQILLDALRRVMAQRKQGKWKSIRNALKIVWSKKEINDVEQRLSAFRDQLALRILLQSKYKLDSTEAQQNQISKSLDTATQTLLRSFARTYQRLKDGINAQTAAIEGLHEQTESVVRQEGQDIRLQIATAQARVEELTIQSAGGTRAVLNSQSDLLIQIDHANDQRREEIDHLQANMERMRQDAAQQIESLKHQIQALHNDLKDLALVMAESVKKQEKKEQERIKYLSKAKVTAILAKEIFIEHLKVFLELFRFNNFNEIRSYTAQFSTLRFQLYPKPINCQRVQHQSSLVSQIGFFLASKRVSLLEPVQAGNVPMAEFFLDNGMHESLSPTQRAKVIQVAFNRLEFDHKVDPGHAFLKQKSARDMAYLLIRHNFASVGDPKPSDVWLNNALLHSAASDWFILETLKTKPHPLLNPAKALTAAVWQGDLETVQNLINQHRNICQVMDERRVSALSLAVVLREQIIVTLLLSNGSSCDREDSSNNTPIGVSIRTSQIEMLNLLLEHGPCLHQGSSLRNCLLQQGPDYLQPDILSTVLQSCKCSDEEDSLMELLKESIHHKRLPAAKFLLNRGVPANGSRICRPILCAVEQNAPEILKLLLDYSASMEVTENFKSALSIAASKGYLSILQSLLSRGANANGAQSSESPTQAAIRATQYECVAILLRHGASAIEHLKFVDWLGVPTQVKICRLLLRNAFKEIEESSPSKVAEALSAFDRIAALASVCDDRDTIEILERQEERLRMATQTRTEEVILVDVQGT